MSDQKECQELVSEEVFLKKLFSLYKKNQEVLLSLQYFFRLFEYSEDGDLSKVSLEKTHAFMKKNLNTINSFLKEGFVEKEIPAWRELIFDIYDEMFSYYQQIFLFFDKSLAMSIESEESE